MISMDRTSIIMWNKNGDSKLPSLGPDLRARIFCFSPLRGVSAVGLICKDFIMLRYFPSIPTFWRVIIVSGCQILSKSFSVSFEMSI